MDAAKPRARRGSETRQKHHRITFRLAASEHAEVADAAARAGQTVGTYIRSRLLDSPVTRAQRRPSVEVQTLTRLQAEMNKVGSNIHQILRRVNFGETPAGEEIRSAFTGYRAVIAAILAALGRGPR